MVKIGELAGQTGLSVRALRHYDAIGLLTPSIRSDAGYRLYGRADVARLHGILALKQLGFSLARIGELLEGGDVPLPEIITQQLAALERQMAQAAALRRQLLRLRALIDGGGEPALADWLTTLELMTMHEKYFDEAELERLHSLKLAAKDDIDTRWPALVARVRALMDEGAPPADPRALDCAAQWSALLERLTGGDATLQLKMHAMNAAEPSEQRRTGIDAAMMRYVQAAIGTARLALYARFLSPEDVERVRLNRERHGADWPPLIAAMRARMQAGASPHDPDVRALAQRWQALFDASMSGGDEGLRARLREAYAREPALLKGTGLDPQLLDFVRAASQP